MDSPATDDDILPLVEELIDGSSEVRLRALKDLEMLDAEHPAIMPALITALKDRDVAVRLAMAQSLERRGAPAIAALMEGLRESRGRQREAILNTILLIGPPARAAVPLLEAMKDDPLFGPLAERALHCVRHGKPTDWRRLFESLTVWIVLCGVLLGVVCELLTWLGAFTRERGVSYEIAVAWAAIGAYFGAVMGLRFSGALGLRYGVKIMGLACAAAGGVAGRLLGQVLEPLIQTLGP